MGVPAEKCFWKDVSVPDERRSCEHRTGGPGGPGAYFPRQILKCWVSQIPFPASLTIKLFVFLCFSADKVVFT